MAWGDGKKLEKIIEEIIREKGWGGGGEELERK